MSLLSNYSLLSREMTHSMQFLSCSTTELESSCLASSPHSATCLLTSDLRHITEPSLASVSSPIQLWWVSERGHLAQFWVHSKNSHWDSCQYLLAMIQHLKGLCLTQQGPPGLRPITAARVHYGWSALHHPGS